MIVCVTPQVEYWMDRNVSYIMQKSLLSCDIWKEVNGNIELLIWPECKMKHAMVPFLLIKLMHEQLGHFEGANYPPSFSEWIINGSGKKKWGKNCPCFIWVWKSKVTMQWQKIAWQYTNVLSSSSCVFESSIFLGFSLQNPNKMTENLNFGQFFASPVTL